MNSVRPHRFRDQPEPEWVPDPAAVKMLREYVAAFPPTDPAPPFSYPVRPCVRGTVADLDLPPADTPTCGGLTPGYRAPGTDQNDDLRDRLEAVEDALAAILAREAGRAAA